MWEATLTLRAFRVELDPNSHFRLKILKKGAGIAVSKEEIKKIM